MALPKVLEEIETAGMDEHLLVVTETVKKIEDRIAARLFRVVAGWQEYAVSDGVPQGFARCGKTFGPPGGENGAMQGEAAQEQQDPSKEPRFIHTARPRRD
jgi:hypothetical protein